MIDFNNLLISIVTLYYLFRVLTPLVHYHFTSCTVFKCLNNQIFKGHTVVWAHVKQSIYPFLHPQHWSFTDSAEQLHKRKQKISCQSKTFPYRYLYITSLSFRDLRPKSRVLSIKTPIFWHPKLIKMLPVMMLLISLVNWFVCVIIRSSHQTPKGRKHLDIVSGLLNIGLWSVSACVLYSCSLIKLEMNVLIFCFN